MRETILALLLASPADTPPCVQELYPLLQHQEFDALRAAADACEQTTGHPRTWYFAGLAYLALGRPERAILALQRYVRSDATDEPVRLRENAQARTEHSKA